MADLYLVEKRLEKKIELTEERIDVFLKLLDKRIEELEERTDTNSVSLMRIEAINKIKETVGIS